MDTAQLFFSGQMRRNADFNLTAIQELEDGKAKCSCGETVTDWKTYDSPSEGSFPMYSCSACDTINEFYHSPVQREYWKQQQRQGERTLATLRIIVIVAIAAAVALAISASH